MRACSFLAQYPNPPHGQDTAPPSGRHLPTGDISHLAIRDNGALLVSLEDADNHDPTGREVIRFVVMNMKERMHALSTIDDDAAYAAARTINRLPLIKKPGSAGGKDETWEKDES